MSLIQSLLNYLKKKNTAEEQKYPEGYCPNCWGRYEYGDHLYEAVQKENLDINTNESDVGWVQSYANKHFAGIALKRQGNGEELICPKCKTSYQHSDEHTNS
ncbi:hypothetical protein [Aureispira anguillae]|uniref:Uncharacterized protein n=1 Tax=Aureispira anguillae TaxID=2864201 RepID=A0A916DWI7_9BACT|nr:hypothetical protein [Aureispira anguillae]BDS15516.1 hypothetical protein AsAng_0063000 [Aureispira anguillae]